MRTGVAVLLFALCWGVAGAQAQTRYHCRDDQGNTYSLSRPCPANARTTAVSAGPAPSRPSYSSSSSGYGSSPVRSVPDTPDHYQYLSARCKSLDENIRSAYSRGIKADVLDGLRREYRRDCRDEERDAYSRLSSERSARDRQRREDEKAAQMEANATREQEARFAQQCAESRRILANKRARTDLTEGEKNDLRRFEEAFMARCKR
ncbi:DUF4124 domain-containing protein [Paracidovorax sp. MALMAid1276]|uniref:DUF4124 domain-containing protein n=1 Tax=Paracidovorax sp. MALMAid1276 TaxID=3411631 RepID=UPI003B9C76EF